LHALLVFVREHLYLRVPAVGDLEPLQPSRSRLGGIAGAEAVEAAEVLVLLAPEHTRVQPSLLRHIPESPPLGLPHRRPVPPNGAGIEVCETEDGGHFCGRFASAVGTDEPDHLPGGDLERKVIQGDNGAVRAAQAVELKQTAHLRTLCRQTRGDVARWAVGGVLKCGANGS
jgi:hypothetical protein